MNTDRIEKKVHLKASLDRVWRAISDPDEFGKWFGLKIAGAFLAGETVRGTVIPNTVDAEIAAAQKQYEGISFDMHVDQVEPRKLFSFRWHPGAIDPNIDYSKEPTTLVVFAIEEADGGVLLTLTETGFDKIPLERRAKVFADNDGGWSMMVKVIAKYVEQGG
jgi:uncharacterized protein YndB with AHSA1/START domain